jgi:hypothetical protein
MFCRVEHRDGRYFKGILDKGCRYSISISWNQFECTPIGVCQRCWLFSHICRYLHRGWGSLDGSQSQLSKSLISKCRRHGWWSHLFIWGWIWTWIWWWCYPRVQWVGSWDCSCVEMHPLYRFRRLGGDWNGGWCSGHRNKRISIWGDHQLVLELRFWNRSTVHQRCRVLSSGLNQQP